MPTKTPMRIPTSIHVMVRPVWEVVWVEVDTRLLQISGLMMNDDEAVPYSVTKECGGYVTVVPVTPPHKGL